MSEEISDIREIIRKDLDSVGFINTGKGVELVSGGDSAVYAGLMCESIYVRIYNGRDLQDVFSYLTGSMCLEEMIAHHFITNALTVRRLLSENNCDQAAVLSILTEGQPEDEKDCIEAIIEACLRTSGEYHISWETDYNHLMEEMLDDAKPSKRMGCGCVSIIVIAFILLFALLYFMFWK